MQVKRMEKYTGITLPFFVLKYVSRKFEIKPVIDRTAAEDSTKAYSL